MGLISEEDVAKFNYNPDDPILLHVQDGYVTAISGGHRADLVNQYFKKIQSDNGEKSSDTINWPSLWVGEPGAGINDSVSGVETGTLSTLRTEKELYVLHFGIGNNYDPDEPKDTQAKSHIDLSLRGQKITMDVKLKDGTIRRIISDEAGRLIYANYQTIAPTTSAS
jgi:leucyl aminopeptidase (aminopeptidase T)